MLFSGLRTGVTAWLTQRVGGKQWRLARPPEGFHGAEFGGFA
jgi:hypothetical protein